jgi:hypothetical protein
MSNLALELLIQERDKQMGLLREAQQRYGDKILELNKAITQLSGISLPETEALLMYDDESPTYITGTEDGI